MEVYILSHIKPNHKASDFYILKSGKVIVEKNIDKYIDETIITFEFDRLIEFQRENKKPLPKDIIDIESLAKLIIGKPKAEFNEDPPWIIWKLMKEFYTNEKEVELEKIRRVYFGILLNDNKTEELFGEFIKKLKTLYENLKKKTIDKNEKERFFTIEKKVNEIIISRSYKGIVVDTNLITKRIKTLNNSLYRIKNKLQLKYKIFAHNDRKHIRQNLKSIGFNYIAFNYDIDHQEYYHLLKLAKCKNFLIFLLYQERKITRNLNALLKIGNLNDPKIYPIYETIGTITGRILVKHPLIQQLSKANRDIILPDKDKALIYIDYSQFEAGILANESQDTKLIFAYKKDIYSELSTSILGNKEYRDLCKKIFFMYSYGAKTEHMDDFLKEFVPNTKTKELKKKVKSFFDNFPKLEKYRQEVESELIEKKKIGTKLGNFRYIEETENEENYNWALSQRIQGTASFILKKAIMKVAESDNEIEFLIPMHDAVLYQVSVGKKEEKEKVIIEIFTSIFKEVCPKLDNPKCEVKSFTE